MQQFAAQASVIYSLGHTVGEAKGSGSYAPTQSYPNSRHTAVTQGQAAYNTQHKTVNRYSPDIQQTRETHSLHTADIDR